MQLRSFTVPFAKVVSDEATELEFGPDDYLVVRPLFSLSRDAVGEWTARITAVQDAAAAAIKLSADAPERAEAEALTDQLVLDMIRAACVEWHLTGPDGEAIDMPGTPAALGALPAGLAGALYPFLSSYRGDPAPNRGTPH